MDLIITQQNNRKISKENAIQYSKSRKFHGYSECSALKNTNIQESFKSFYTVLYEKNKYKLEEKSQMKMKLLDDLKKEHMNNPKCC